MLMFISDGQGLSPARARPEARVFQNAQSPTFGEGPKPELSRPRARLLGKGWKIQAFLLLYIVKFQGLSRPGARPAFMEGLKPGPGLGPTLQSPGSALARLFRARPISNSIGKKQQHPSR